MVAVVTGKRSLTSKVSTDTKSDSKIISFSVAAGSVSTAVESWLSSA
jgi:hypothetical protein